uniref:Uncharacterized protein n=1 Tax=Aegilops tauschii subsp. strangulata TaxID=200361 RepID=A0A453R5C6_AEGTS
AAGRPLALAPWLARPMSSHDAHLTRDEVVGRVLDVLKCHPKVDPSKVTPLPRSALKSASHRAAPAPSKP